MSLSANRRWNCSLVYWGDSTGRRNALHHILFDELVERLCRRPPAQRLARPRIQCVCNGAQFGVAVLAEVRALGEVLAKQAVGVLVASALPRALRIAEVDVETGVDPKLRVLRHLGALIPGQRASQFRRQPTDRPGDGIQDGLGAVAGEGRTFLDGLARPVPFHARQVQEHGEAGRALDQRADRRAQQLHRARHTRHGSCGISLSGERGASAFSRFVQLSLDKL